MKKQILSIVLLLSLCTSQAILGSEERAESASLLEKYFPGVKTLKKVVYAGVFFSLFGGAKALSFEPTTFDNCLSARGPLVQKENELRLAWNGYVRTLRDDEYEAYYPFVDEQPSLIWQWQQEKIWKLDEKCFRQLDSKDRIRYFKQLNHLSQQMLVERLSREELQALNKALKKSE